MTLLASLNALLSAVFICAYALWGAPTSVPRIAVLDVGELYRLKEQEIATVLVKRETSVDEREAAIKRAAAFGAEVSTLIQSLPEECHCLILARGAVVGPAGVLFDLTPEVRRRLGL